MKQYEIRRFALDDTCGYYELCRESLLAPNKIWAHDYEEANRAFHNIFECQYDDVFNRMNTYISHDYIDDEIIVKTENGKYLLEVVEVK